MSTTLGTKLPFPKNQAEMTKYRSDYTFSGGSWYTKVAPVTKAPTPPVSTTPTTTPTSTPSTYTGVSIVDYLKSVGQASSYSARSSLSQQYGISNYTGASSQNTQLLNLLRSGAVPTPTSTPTSTPTTDWSALERKYFAAASSNWTSTWIKSGTGETRWYRRENGQWVQKSSEAESKQPWSRSPDEFLYNGVWYPDKEAAIKAGLGGSQEGIKTVSGTMTEKTGYTGVSIVDYLKSVGQSSDYSSRAKLAASNGISNYTGTAAQNTQLLNILKSGTGTSEKQGEEIAPVEEVPEAEIIEEDDDLVLEGDDTVDQQEKEDADKAEQQDKEIEQLTKAQQVAVLKADLKALGFDFDFETGKVVEKPGLPTYEDDFEALRSEHGIEALETQLNTVNKTIADKEAALRAGMYDVEGKLKPMELIGTEQRELARQAQEEMDTLTRRKNSLIDEYNTKANLVNSIMGFKQMDYTAAVNDYNLTFNSAVKMLDILEGRETKEDQKAAQVKTDATANFNILTGLIQESGTSWADVSADTKLELKKLALKMDLPYDIIETYMENNQGTTFEPVTNTTSYEDDGRQFITFWSKDKSGKMKQEKYYTGGTKTGAAGGMNDAERQADINSFLSDKIGGDTKISAQSYMDAYKRWIGNGGSVSDFKYSYPVEQWLGSWEWENLPEDWRPSGGGVTPVSDLPADTQVYIVQLQHDIDQGNLEYNDVCASIPDACVYLKPLK